MATVVSQVGQGHCYVDNGGRIFKQSAGQLSHVTERERMAQEAVRESQDPSRDVDHVSDEPELPRQPSQTSGQENNVAPVSQPDVSMPDHGPPETPDETAETSDDDRENTAEPVPTTNCCKKKPPTGGEEKEIRQKRLRSEPVPELFPLTGEELSEDVFEILIDLFASPGSEHIVEIPVFQHTVKIPEIQNFVQVPVFWKLTCTLKIEIVSDR